ncbi:MAG: hypothetical protein KC994_01485 [Candidatus Omnitrophica bacterium]|nr:hypothetical protein [Candidatus Omnitrophota bacterium]
MLRRNFFLLFGVGFLPCGLAHGCGACAMSNLNLTFPFMWEATWIFSVWYVVNLYFQLEVIKKNPTFFFASRLVLLGVLWLFFFWACFFVFLVGSFVNSLTKMVRDFRTGHKGKTPRFALISQILVILVLIPIAANAYATYADRDQLERFRSYIEPGTAVSHHFARKIGQDPSFNLKHIREMLESPEDKDSIRAFEILEIRESAKDLIALKDIVLEIPESEYSWETHSSPRTSVYLPLWLEKVTGKEIKTKEELRSWITEVEKARDEKGAGSETISAPETDGWETGEQE